MLGIIIPEQCSLTSSKIGRTMKRISLISTFLLLTTSSIASSNRGQTALNDVIDPMHDIPPMDVDLERQQNDVQGGGGRSVTAAKRFADGKQLIVLSQSLEGRDNEAKSVQEESNTRECAYTFIVPSEAAQASACVDTKQSSRISHLSEIRADVLTAKLRVEEIRNEINEEKRQLSNSDIISTIQDRIEHLEQESTNMEQRVSQLYMQLLHEIINKRDNTIEVQELENKLLNQTIHYYALLEKHERLQSNHNALREQVNSQSEALEGLRQQFENFNTVTQVEVCRCNTTQAKEDNPKKAGCEKEDVPTTPSYPNKTNFPPGPFRDCTEVQKAGYIRSGTFNIRLRGSTKKMRVWCDLEQDPGGWTVIQRRTGRRIKFNKDMKTYKRGFGRSHSDHWIGLDNLHQITNQTGMDYKLHMELEDWEGRKRFAEYRSFRVEGETTGYKLRITHYSGNAGDSLTWHNNMAFTTSDADNDMSEANCAHIHRGGWWYRDCARSNLNGIYYRGGYYRSRHQDGVYWTEWRGTTYSLKSVTMKIRPLE